MNRMELMRTKAQLGAEINKTDILEMFGEIVERVERLENMYAELAQDRRAVSKKTNGDVSPSGVPRRGKQNK